MCENEFKLYFNKVYSALLRIRDLNKSFKL